MSIPTNSFPLWPEHTPINGPLPTLTPVLPAEPGGAAFVICPGGGYGFLAPHEGVPVGEWLASLGITAFVLHYRIAPHGRHPDQLNDAARAVRTVRANAVAWNLDPERIGVLGFSAGGHLASTIATHWTAGDPQASDPLDRVSSRPNAAVLIYPVITLEGPYAHAGSRDNLLGPEPDPALVAALSNERQVNAQTPPTFLVHSADDLGVSCVNSFLFAQALAAHGVVVELQLYERGDHGYGMGGDDPLLRTWPDRCADWLRRRGFVGG
jgi:acetyl esterase/lipase